MERHKHRPFKARIGKNLQRSHHRKARKRAADDEHLRLVAAAVKATFPKI